MTSDVYAIIPARSGSKGVADKNIRPLAGKPLIAYSIEAALAAESIARVFVSTDSSAYRDLALSLGAEAPFLRPANLAGDTSADIDVMIHFLNWLSQAGDTVPRLLVHLRPTTPLRDHALIDGAVAAIEPHPEATALRSVHEMAETAYKCVERDGDYLVSAFTKMANLEMINGPRQDFPETYVANGYVDILKADTILQAGKIHGDRVLGFVTPPTTEIDREEDFAYLEFEISRSAAAVMHDETP